MRSRRPSCYLLLLLVTAQPAYGCRALDDARRAEALSLRVDPASLEDTRKAAAGEARITDAVLGHDRIDKANGYEIVDQTTEFRPDSPKIVCVFKVEGASLGTTVKGVWIAEETGGMAPPNYKILEKSLTLPFINTGSLVITRPDNGWPVGSYRLEIYFGDTLAKTVKFTVKTP